jgi:hypothetical protein
VWSLVEYEGKLAVTLPWTPETDEPVESRDLWVSPKEKWDVGRRILQAVYPGALD